MARAYETAVLLTAGGAAGPVIATDRLREGSAAHDPPAMVAARREAVLREIARERPGRTVAVVTHGYVLRAFLAGCGYAALASLPGGAVADGGYFVCRVGPNGPPLVERTRGVRVADSGAPRVPAAPGAPVAGVAVRRVRAADRDERAEWLRLRA